MHRILAFCEDIHAICKACTLVIYNLRSPQPPATMALVITIPLMHLGEDQMFRLLQSLHLTASSFPSAFPNSCLALWSLPRLLYPRLPLPSWKTEADSQHPAAHKPSSLDSQWLCLKGQKTKVIPHLTSRHFLLETQKS